MVERGTYSEFLKSGIDIFSLFEKNEQSEPSSVPGTPTVISESLGQSPRPSLKDEFLILQCSWVCLPLVVS